MAICRLKRVAADNKTSILDRLPKIPKRKNGKKVALIGGGPASLTVARDLAPLGPMDLYDDQPAGGGFMRPDPLSFTPYVLDEEVDYILDMGIHTQFNTYVDSLKGVLDKGTTRSLLVPVHREVVTSIYPAARSVINTSTWVLSGWDPSPSNTFIKLASACSCSAAAIPQWTAAEQPDALAVKTSKSWCAPSLHK